MATVGLEPGTF